MQATRLGRRASNGPWPRLLVVGGGGAAVREAKNVFSLLLRAFLSHPVDN